MSESEKKEVKGVFLEDDVLDQKDEPLEFNKDGVPTFLLKRTKKSELEELVEDGIVEDVDGEWRN